MEHQESYELLLSRIRQIERDMAFGDEAKPTEEFDAQSRSISHRARVYTFEPAVDFVFLMNRMCDSRVHPAQQGVRRANEKWQTR
jgi:hypothetical protein